MISIKTAVIFASILLLVLFGTLSLSLEKTTDLLEFESQELAKAGESIRVAQGLKNRLLLHNRNSLLYQLNNDSSRFEGRKIPRNEINEFLNLATNLIIGPEEQSLLIDVKQQISDYLEKWDKLDNEPISPLEKYNLVSRDIDDAISAVDKLVLLKRSQMSNLLESVGQKNRAANRLAKVFFSVGSVMLLGLIFSSFLFVARPLLNVAHVIDRYGAGEMANRVDSNCLAEIQKIGSNFNSMADRLEEKRQDQLRFIAFIAHDLRNPLNSMSMASELLIRKGQEEDRKLCKIIFRQVQNLDRLVGDLLDTTRIEAGQLDLNLSEQDVNSLVMDSVELHRTGSGLHAFKLELIDNALICNCDRGRLSQVMNNLLSNAVKYSPNGGTITVKSWREDKTIKISVTDQGIGIDPKDLDNIFRPFHRTKATKDTIPGVGLGLSVSRRIIEAHSGSLRVESVPGKGSTFYITLPIMDMAQRSPARSVVPSGRDHGPTAEI